MDPIGFVRPPIWLPPGVGEGRTRFGGDAFGQLGWPGTGWIRLPDADQPMRFYAPAGGAIYDPDEAVDATWSPPHAISPSSAATALAEPILRGLVGGELDWVRFKWDALPAYATVLGWNMVADAVWGDRCGVRIALFWDDASFLVGHEKRGSTSIAELGAWADRLLSTCSSASRDLPPIVPVALEETRHESLDELVRELHPIAADVDVSKVLASTVVESWTGEASETTLPSLTRAEIDEATARVDGVVGRTADVTCYALAQFALGNYLHVRGGFDDRYAARQAVTALRRAIRYLEFAPLLKAHAMKSLGDSLSTLADPGSPEKQMARRTLELAAHACCAEGDMQRAASCGVSLASLILHEPDDPASARAEACAVLRSAMRLCPREQDLAQWAAVALELVRVLALPGAANEEGEDAEMRSLSSEVLRLVSADATLKGRPEALALFADASYLTHKLDWNEFASPVPELDLADVVGLGLYLRPWSSAQTLMVPERCVVPSTFEVELRPLNDRLRLEGVLFRALFPRFPITGVGGPPESGGGGRLAVPGVGDDWKSLVERLIDDMKLILVVAEDTPALRWEVQTIVAKRALQRTVLIMLPSSATPVRPASLWAEARDLFADVNIELPHHKPEGAFLGFDDQGRIDEGRSFDAAYSLELAGWVEDRFR